MSRSTLIAATLVAALALILVVIGITHPFSNVGNGPTSSPAANLGEPIGELTSGTYTAATFTEPFSLVIPREPSSLAAGPTTGDLWEGHRTLRIKVGVTADLGIGALTIHDDVFLDADICDAGKGTIADVPTSVQAIGSWLTASSGLTVSEGRPILVGGREGMSWDIALPADCAVGGGAAGAVVGFESGEHHRVYAIPTGTDTIIAFTWGSGYRGEGEEKLSDVNAWADQVVASMRFN